MENKVKDQIVTDRYAIYNSDCMLVLPTLENESIDLILFADHEKIYSQVIFYCKQFNVNYD